MAAYCIGNIAQTGGSVRTCILSVVVILLTTANSFSSESVWIHNGSKIKWEADGQRRTAFYLQPRPGLEVAGIRPGTKLFEGVRKGSVLSGTSYSFKNGCETIAFPVSATITDERQIVLTGEAPVRTTACSTSTATKTVTLQLDFVPDESAAAQDSGVPSAALPGADIPKPSAGVQEKLKALQNEADADRRQNEQGSSFTVCNATTDRASVAFGRNGRVRGWTTVHSGTCEMIEKMTSAQRIKFYAKTKNSEYHSGTLELTCVESRAFARADGEPCETGDLVGFTTRTLKRGEQYTLTLRPAAGQPEAEISEGD